MPGNIVSSIVTNWPKIALAFALIGVGAASAKTVKTVQEVPALLARHDSASQALRQEIETDLMSELHKQTQLQQQSLCLQVALLRHSDWTVCLLP